MFHKKPMNPITPAPPRPKLSTLQQPWRKSFLGINLKPSVKTFPSPLHLKLVVPLQSQSKALSPFFGPLALSPPRTLFYTTSFIGERGESIPAEEMSQRENSCFPCLNFYIISTMIVVCLGREMQFADDSP